MKSKMQYCKTHKENYEEKYPVDINRKTIIKMKLINNLKVKKLNVIFESPILNRFAEKTHINYTDRDDLYA